MAEDEETATARYIASNISTQLMLKTIIEIISTMSDDPDKYRARLKAKLFELADTMPLAAMTPTREDKVRAFVRETPYRYTRGGACRQGQAARRRAEADRRMRRRPYKQETNDERTPRQDNADLRYVSLEKGQSSRKGDKRPTV